jgi:glycosyltransferase involved in cell wall biosynthesis
MTTPTEKKIISVLVCVYNHENTIEASVNSVLEQKLPRGYTLEILIGDDNSSDNSASLIDKMAAENSKTIKSLKNEKNVGGSKNFTQLLNEACGKYITWIEADDLWLTKTKLLTMISYFEINPQFYGIGHLVTKNIKPQIPRSPNSTHQFKLAHLIAGKVFPVTSLIVKNPGKDVINQLIEDVNSGPRNAGDLIIAFWILNISDILIINQELAHYNFVMNKSASNYNSITDMDQKFKDKALMLNVIKKRYPEIFLMILRIKFIALYLLNVLKRKSKSNFFGKINTIYLLMFNSKSVLK